MKITGIYQIQSKIKPERVYIGSAVNIDKRWRGHLSALKLGKHDNSKLQNHYNKYGRSDLQFSILLGCEKKDLIKNEQWFMDSYNPFFNITKTAYTPLGHKISENLGEKISASLKKWYKENPISEEVKQKMRERMKGSNNPNYGKPRPEETRQKISEKYKEFYKTDKGIALKKKLGKRDLSGKNNPMYGVHRYGKDAPGYKKHLHMLEQK